jgi:hypothetical protein
VEHAHPPSLELRERANGIRMQWIDYREATIGHRASMTTNLRRASSRSAGINRFLLWQCTRDRQRMRETIPFLFRNGSLYFGWVIAPCEAEETNAAYFANTPVG